MKIFAAICLRWSLGLALITMVATAMAYATSQHHLWEAVAMSGDTNPAALALGRVDALQSVFTGGRIALGFLVLYLLFAVWDAVLQRR